MGSTAQVRYGADTRWVQRTLTGTVSCTNTFFGSDPAVGASKSCQAAAPFWLIVANENQAFTLSGTFVVRYGADTRWAQRTLSAGNYNCNNATFGDPARGTAKTCQVLRSS